MSNWLSNYGGPETLLVVDDNEQLLNMLKFWICDNGYNVITAVDGCEAIETYKNCNDIQLVLMDILMPRKDGITASIEMREHNPNATLILMSGYFSNKTLLSSVRSVVPKPFLPSKIIKMIRNHLDGNFCEYNEC